MTVYPATRIKRNRATRNEMEERAAFLIDYAQRHGPVHLPLDQLEVLKVAEASEHRLLTQWAREACE